MINLTKNDIKDLAEMYQDSIIEGIDLKNVNKIYNYLIDNNIYFAKDIFIENLDLFLLDFEEFKIKFERLKKKLGNNYVDLLIYSETDYWQEMYK